MLKWGCANLGVFGDRVSTPLIIEKGEKTPTPSFPVSPYPLNLVGHTPKGAYSSRVRSRHLLETAFSEPLLRTLLRTLFCCKNHSRPPSQNPSENPFPRTLPRTFSEPFLERCVAVQPLRRAPNLGVPFHPLNFGVGVPETPLFYSTRVFWGPPPKFRGEIVTP